MSEAFPLNLDLTTEKLFTLSRSTRELIGKITSERPVTIQAFISADVPREQVAIQRRLKGLLRQYDREGGARLDVRFVDVAPFTPEAEEARLLGVQSMQVATDEDGRRGVQEVFMGVVVSSPVDEVVVPVFEAGTSIEYELTRSIRTVANEKRLTVGILTTDARVAGGFDMSNFRQLPEWAHPDGTQEAIQGRASPGRFAHRREEVRRPRGGDALVAVADAVAQPR